VPITEILSYMQTLRSKRYL